MDSTNLRDTNAPLKLIAIAGPSCSGKTTLAHALRKRLGEQTCTVLPVDSYYHDLSHLKPQERAQHNFDDPSSIDSELLLRHISQLLNGKSAAIPNYDFNTHSRRPETTTLPPKPYLLLEGLHALHWKNIRDLAATKIFLDLDHTTCLQRRVARDVSERGRSETLIRRQYETTVRPTYDSIIAPTRSHADLILPGTAPQDDNLQTILNALNT